MTFAYDDVPYYTEANQETHPSSIATLARLAGRTDFAMPSRARVLEIGCGNGENLIAQAAYLPDATFVGFDLAQSAIEIGKAAVKEADLANVDLFVADIRDVNFSASPISAREFDYVIAHGMYSWVPEEIRADLLAIMHRALAPNGLGFISVNALPGWELRRALRELVMDDGASRSKGDAKAQVEEALRVIREIARGEESAHGFARVLGAAAREYLAHVANTRPNYVFHDLLAEYNDAFSVDDLAARLARAKLTVVCETPLRKSRASPTFESLAIDMAKAGTPFLQLIVARATGSGSSGAHEPRPAIDLHLWADLTPVSLGTYKTTTGATVKPIGDDGLARAAQHAPGFVALRGLANDEAALADQLFAGMCEGVFTLFVEPPFVAIDSSSSPPCVANHVRARARRACDERASSTVLTSALHRPFRVPWSELAIARELDGVNAIADIVANARKAAIRVPPSLAGPLGGGATDRESERFVAMVIDRFRRHLFLVPPPPVPPQKA